MIYSADRRSNWILTPFWFSLFIHQSDSSLSMTNKCAILRGSCFRGHHHPQHHRHHPPATLCGCFCWSVSIIPVINHIEMIVSRPAHHIVAIGEVRQEIEWEINLFGGATSILMKHYPPLNAGQPHSFSDIVVPQNNTLPEVHISPILFCLRKKMGWNVQRNLRYNSRNTLDGCGGVILVRLAQWQETFIVAL